MTIALTDVEQQMLIASQIGDVDPVTGERVSVYPPGHGGIIMQNADVLWRKWADKDLLWPGLRALYVQRDAIDLVLGIARLDVDVTGPDATGVRYSQRVTALQKMHDGVEAEIVRQEEMMAGGVLAQAPAIGPIAQTAPIMPPNPGELPPDWLMPDANSPRYMGSPYWRSRGSPE